MEKKDTKTFILQGNIQDSEEKLELLHYREMLLEMDAYHNWNYEYKSLAE